MIAVDDSEDILTLLKIGFRNFPDIELNTFTSGQAALNAMAEKNLDLIILDVLMPEITGPDLYNEIRKIDKLRTTPIFFLTALDDESEVGGLLQSGASGILKKPFFPKKIAQEILDAWKALK